MRALAALLLLAACASTREVATPVKSAPRWPASLQKSVFSQCYAQKPSKSYCACIAFSLEQFSPDPDVEFTDSDFAGAHAVCEPEESGGAL